MGVGVIIISPDLPFVEVNSVLSDWRVNLLSVEVCNVGDEPNIMILGGTAKDAQDEFGVGGGGVKLLLLSAESDPESTACSSNLSHCSGSGNGDAGKEE